MMTRLRGDAQAGRPSRGLLLPAQARRPPSPPATFEFVHIIGSEMSTAEDIILRGRLLPYKPPPASPASARSLTPAAPPAACGRGRGHRRCPSDASGHEGHRGRHRRAESLDGYERGDGAASRYWKTKGSHSADYQRLRTLAEAACDARAGARQGAQQPPPPPPPPKWYVLMFGSVTVPAEMDMRSIKGRLRRRTASDADAVRVDSVGGVKAGGAGGVAWKFLRSLSCKGDAAGVVDGAALRSYTST